MTEDFHHFLSESCLTLLSTSASNVEAELSKIIWIFIATSNLNYKVWGPGLLKTAQRQSKNTGSNKRKEGIQSRREKERSKNPEKHLEAFSASSLKEEGLMPQVC